MISEQLEKLRDWHNTQIDNWMYKLNIDEYTAYWISFFKGVVLTLLLIWIF
tara:strand:- start:50783 stop:50935 length:153 start_codon:yes stop_codon:yes gene_type:complete